MKEERLTVRFYLVVGVGEDTNHVDFGAHHAKPAIQKEFKTGGSALTRVSKVS
jgi:hypothetical protein